MSENTSEATKPNWPFIIAGAVVALGVLTVAGAVLLMWIYNFNLLEWME